jgi:hypothetical protein
MRRISFRCNADVVVIIVVYAVAKMVVMYVAMEVTVLLVDAKNKKEYYSKNNPQIFFNLGIILYAKKRCHTNFLVQYLFKNQ